MTGVTYANAFRMPFFLLHLTNGLDHRGSTHQFIVNVRPLSISVLAESNSLQDPDTLLGSEESNLGSAKKTSFHQKIR